MFLQVFKKLGFGYGHKLYQYVSYVCYRIRIQIKLVWIPTIKHMAHFIPSHFFINIIRKWFTSQQARFNFNLI